MIKARLETERFQPRLDQSESFDCVEFVPGGPGDVKPYREAELGFTRGVSRDRARVQALRVRSPCSISFQNSRVLPS